jgi:hypothetical protein
VIPAEEEYLELVGTEGHEKAKRTLEVLCNYNNSEMVVKLYYLTLTNAYWRGVNAGVDKARAIISAKKGTVDEYGKPTN